MTLHLCIYPSRDQNHKDIKGYKYYSNELLGFQCEVPSSNMKQFLKVTNKLGDRQTDCQKVFAC